MAKELEIRVRNKQPRYSFDGQTGIYVLAGTLGTVGAMTTYPKAGSMPPHAKLTIYWDAVIVQDAANDEPSNYEGWEESEVRAAEIEAIGTREVETDQEVTRG